MSRKTLAALVIPVLLAVSGHPLVRGQTPNGTRTFIEGTTTFTLIEKDGHTTLLAVDETTKLNFEGAFTTEAERARVPPVVLNGFRLAYVHRELPAMDPGEWAVIGVRLAKVLQLQTWTAAAFDGDPLCTLADVPADPENPLAATSQHLQDVLSKSVLPDAELKTAMAAYRDAYRHLQDDLAAARLNLLQVLTVRQEAVLIRLGVLH
jgi:hypothetical protein